VGHFQIIIRVQSSSLIIVYYGNKGRAAVTCSLPQSMTDAKAWNVVSVLSTVPGLVEIIEKVGQIIGPLIGAG